HQGHLREREARRGVAAESPHQTLRAAKSQPLKRSGDRPSRAIAVFVFGSPLAKGALPMGYPITADNPARNNPFRFYVADNIRQKGFRRTKAAVAGIRTAIIDILSKDNPQTVRQVFYALTVRGVITKAEIEYQRTVVRLLGEMREAGTISFE